MSQINYAEQKDLGYVFSPSRRPSEPGYARLDIVLNATPSEQHFDPSHVRVMVAHEKGVDYWMVEHPWSGEKSLHVCAGPLDIVDRKNKRVEVFTFGGLLMIEVHEPLTLITFSSPSPILLMRARESVSSLFAIEAEILLAERCAALENKPGEFDSRLAVVDPIVLYRSILCAVQARLEKLPGNENELWLHFRHVLREENKILLEERQYEPCQDLAQIL